MSESLLLPFDRHSTCGFFFPVELKESTVAGIGRFAGSSIRKGQTVRADNIIPLSQFIKDGGVKETQAGAVQLTSEGDLDELVDFWLASQPDQKARVEEQVSWMVASCPKNRTDLGRGFTYILAHSFHINHSTKPNIVTDVSHGVYFHRACKDIKHGEEFFLDYMAHGMPDWTQSWCVKRNLKDGQMLCEEIEGYKGLNEDGGWKSEEYERAMRA